MPEGPEIHRHADRVRAAIGGQPVEVSFGLDRLAEHERPLSGRRVRGVEARGKALLVRLEPDWNVFTHLQLYGRWRIRDAGDYPETNRQLRAAFVADERMALLYSASEIEVLRDDALSEQSYLAGLGPDVLDPGLAVDDVVARLGDAAFRRRQLATLLLDQGFLAGLGNYLRSEILFAARVAPDDRPVDLSDEERRAVAEACLTLARRSYETGGITNDPERVAELEEQGASYRRYRWAVFGQVGEPCPRCGTAIERIRKGGRRLDWCPACQG